ncbi:hypothetical protein PQX77_017308 [Marasmius sp. AFHP31]|nr:hypothetical protein PQX77_017308 [Marasmius sp. AFHP31]
MVIKRPPPLPVEASATTPTIMKFTSTLITLTIASLTTLALAVDNRLLFQVPAGDTTETFQPKFVETCQNWPEASGLTLQTVTYQVGDWQGKNNETQVKLICSYHDNVPTTITFTKQVAESLGATEI